MSHTWDGVGRCGRCVRVRVYVLIRWVCEGGEGGLDPLYPPPKCTPHTRSCCPTAYTHTYSLASWRVKDKRAPLVAAYAGIPAWLASPCTLAMLTMLPPPAESMWGMACFEKRTKAVRVWGGGAELCVWCVSISVSVGARARVLIVRKYVSIHHRIHGSAFTTNHTNPHHKTTIPLHPQARLSPRTYSSS